MNDFPDTTVTLLTGHYSNGARANRCLFHTEGMRPLTLSTDNTSGLDRVYQFARQQEWSPRGDEQRMYKVTTTRRAKASLPWILEDLVLEAVSHGPIYCAWNEAGDWLVLGIDFNFSYWALVSPASEELLPFKLPIQKPRFDNDVVVADHQGLRQQLLNDILFMFDPRTGAQIEIETLEHFFNGRALDRIS